MESWAMFFKELLCWHRWKRFGPYGEIEAYQCVHCKKEKLDVPHGG